MSLLRRSAVLLSGETAARALGVLLYALLARQLGVARFGILSLGMTVALIAGTVVDLGQTAHAARSVARAPATAWQTVQMLIRNKTVLGLVTCVVVAVGLPLAHFSHAETAVAVAMTAWAAILSVFESERALLRSLGMHKRDAAANSSESLLRVLLVLGVAVFTGTLFGATAAFVVEATVAVVILTILFRGWVPRLEEAVAERGVRFLRGSIPIGVGAIALAFFYRIDQAFVTGIAGAVANGLYGAAARIAFTANVVAQIVVAAAYPELASLHAEPAAFRRALWRALIAALTASAVAAAAVAVFAGPIIHVLYGSKFAGAVPLLRVLSLTVLFNGVSALGLYSAVALQRERRSLALILVLTPLVVIGYYEAVGRYGAVGAAWVSVAAEIALAIGLLALSFDRLQTPEALA